MQYLSHTQAVGGRTIGFHICNGGRLPAPGTVDKEFCVNAGTVEKGVKSALKKLKEYID